MPIRVPIPLRFRGTEADQKRLTGIWMENGSGGFMGGKPRNHFSSAQVFKVNIKLST